MTSTELGSITGAAGALNMPKSSVSRSLVRLEGVAGFTLIERSTRRLLRVTAAGNILLGQARRILVDVGEAQKLLAELIGVPRGTLLVNPAYNSTVRLLTSTSALFTREDFEKQLLEGVQSSRRLWESGNVSVDEYRASLDRFRAFVLDDKTRAE